MKSVIQKNGCKIEVFSIKLNTINIYVYSQNIITQWQWAQWAQKRLTTTPVQRGPSPCLHIEEGQTHD